MKAMIAILSLIVGTQALAEVKRPGTVLGSKCATAASISSKPGTTRRFRVAPTMCTASVVGVRAGFVTLNSEVWQITGPGRLQYVGEIVDGLLQYSTATVVLVGQYKLTEDTLTLKVRGTTYVSKQLEIIYHTQSL